MAQSGRTRGRLALVLMLAALAFGCGPALYTASIRSAEQKLQQARDENARWYAPYEFYYAESHLLQAQQEAAESSYEDALRYARTAHDFSQRALEITQRRRLVER
jgi:hypothetical protein